MPQPTTKALADLTDTDLIRAYKAGTVDVTAMRLMQGRVAAVLSVGRGWSWRRIADATGDKRSNVHRWARPFMDEVRVEIATAEQIGETDG